MAPVDPMLAQTAKDVDEALETLQGDVAFEWKMDGARIQVHKQGDLVRIFTRGLNEVTAAIPEIADQARRLPADELVLDGEAIAFAPTGRPHAFQTTMRRFGRKLRCRPAAAGTADTRVLLRLPVARQDQPGRTARAGTVRSLVASGARCAIDSAAGHAIAREAAAAFYDAGNGAGTRGPDGQITGRTV